MRRLMQLLATVGLGAALVLAPAFGVGEATKALAASSSLPAFPWLTPDAFVKYGDKAHRISNDAGAVHGPLFERGRPTESSQMIGQVYDQMAVDDEAAQQALDADAVLTSRGLVDQYVNAPEAYGGVSGGPLPFDIRGDGIAVPHSGFLADYSVTVGPIVPGTATVHESVRIDIENEAGGAVEGATRPIVFCVDQAGRISSGRSVYGDLSWMEGVRVETNDVRIGYETHTTWEAQCQTGGQSLLMVLTDTDNDMGAWLDSDAPKWSYALPDRINVRGSGSTRMGTTVYASNADARLAWFAPNHPFRGGTAGQSSRLERSIECMDGNGVIEVISDVIEMVYGSGRQLVSDLVCGVQQMAVNAWADWFPDSDIGKAASPKSVVKKGTATPFHGGNPEGRPIPQRCLIEGTCVVDLVHEGSQCSISAEHQAACDMVFDDWATSDEHVANDWREFACMYGGVQVDIEVCSMFRDSSQGNVRPKPNVDRDGNPQRPDAPVPSDSDYPNEGKPSVGKDPGDGGDGGGDGWLGQIGQWIADQTKSIGDAIGSTAESIGAAISFGVDVLGQGMEGIANRVTDALSSLGDAVAGLFVPGEGVIEGYMNGLGDAFAETALGAAGDMVSGWRFIAPPDGCEGLLIPVEQVWEDGENFRILEACQGDPLEQTAGTAKTGLMIGMIAGSVLVSSRLIAGIVGYTGVQEGQAT